MRCKVMLVKLTLMLLILFTASNIYYGKALQMKDPAPATEVANADWYYNLGVDNFQQGEAGKACLYWLRALNLDSSHRQARANLDLAINLSPDSAIYPRQPYLAKLLTKLLAFFSVNRLAWLSLMLLSGTGACLIWLIAYDPDKERALPIMVLSFLLISVITTFTVMGIKWYRQLHNPLGVVISPRCQLYSITQASPITEVHAGLIVRVLEGNQESFTVRLPDGRGGRILAGDLARVLESNKGTQVTPSN